MSEIDYTLVVGVDDWHFRQLCLTWPTWKKHKPSLLEHPMVIFNYHRVNLPPETPTELILEKIDHPHLKVVRWPIKGLSVDEEADWNKENKFGSPHREVMLSGFVYVPALFVNTKYWFKLDTDVVATGNDNWIDPSWFKNDPAIVAHRWTFTRPPDQILKMDAWVEKNKDKLPASVTENEPLKLAPPPGWDRVGHKRIISWCGFFDTEWTFQMSSLTQQEDERYRLPVPSQDGYLWYMAKRMGRGIVRVNMKSLGWQHWHTWGNVEKHAREAMR